MGCRVETDLKLLARLAQIFGVAPCGTGPRFLGPTSRVPWGTKPRLAGTAGDQGLYSYQSVKPKSAKDVMCQGRNAREEPTGCGAVRRCRVGRDRTGPFQGQEAPKGLEGCRLSAGWWAVSLVSRGSCRRGGSRGGAWRDFPVWRPVGTEPRLPGVDISG